jgi:DNA-binding GntR family transcriptional regulator
MKTSKSESAARSSLSAQVVNSILEKIAKGELLPGDRVIEARIAEELHVSSIPVREAIRELAAKRVLEYVLHKGARVREVSMPETIDALEVKAVLESLAARLGSERLKGKVPQLRKNIAPMRDSLLKHDHIRYQLQNQDFHRIIVETAENAILFTLWEYLAFEVRTRPIMDYMKGVEPETLIAEHEMVIDAIVEGDKGKVASLLSTHSNHLVKHLQKQMSRNAEEAKKYTTSSRKERRRE